MPDVQCEKADGTCENTGDPVSKPLTIGRLARLLTGLLQLWFVWTLITNTDIVTREEPLYNIGFWIGAILAFLLLPWTLNLAYDVTWGRKPFYAAAGLAVIAIAFNLISTGSWWGAPLMNVVFAVSVYVHGHMGLCHVLAGLMGTPGCEMKAIPQVWAMLKGDSNRFVPCPGFWKNLDAWEHRVFGKGDESPT